MARVINKPDGSLTVLVNLTLKPGRDDAAIMLVRNAPPRTLAALIREAMRSGIIIPDQADFITASFEMDLPDLGIDL